MTRPAFLADEDLRHAIVLALIGLDPTIDFATVQDVGLRSSPDDDVLAYAASSERIVVSHDVNTMRAAAILRVASGLPMNGLLLTSQLASTGRIAQTLLMIAQDSTSGEWKNVVDFIPW